LHNELKPPKSWRPKNGDVIFMGGVWKRGTLVNMSKLVGSKGKVIACEANPISYKNIMDQGINRINVTYINKALWNCKSTMQFEATVNEYHGFDKLVDPSIPFGFPKNLTDSQTIEVQCDTIDSILEGENCKVLDYMELTINGAECEALNGAKDIIKNSPNIVIKVMSVNPKPLDGLLEIFLDWKMDIVVRYAKNAQLNNKSIILAGVWAKKRNDI